MPSAITVREVEKDDIQHIVGYWNNSTTEDLLAMGIDVNNITLVINYNLPEDPRNYIHRIGRTARAGKSGMAISFAVENDIRQLTNIENSIGLVIPVVTEQPFHKEFSKVPIQDKKKKQVKKTNRTRNNRK